MQHDLAYRCNGTEQRLILCEQEVRECDRDDNAGVMCRGGKTTSIQ